MDEEDYCVIDLNDNSLKVFRNGKVEILKQRNPNKGLYYEKKYNKHTKGYKQLELWFKGKVKIYFVHRIIAYTYLKLDITNKKCQVDHINRNKSNNDVSNFRLVTNQENSYNKNARGYYKKRNEYISQIMPNGKTIHLGKFATEVEARDAYLLARRKYFGEYA